LVRRRVRLPVGRMGAVNDETPVPVAEAKPEDKIALIKREQEGGRLLMTPVLRPGTYGFNPTRFCGSLTPAAHRESVRGLLVSIRLGFVDL
jgi:hypothetical protein